MAERFDEAAACLDRERTRTAAELAAFDAFEGELRSIATESVSVDPDAPVASVSRLGGTAGAPGVTGNGAGFRAVRGAYESTVLALSHYDEEYDETVAESVAGELGPDVATALTGQRPFDEAAKRAILTATREAQERRDALLDVLDAERESTAAAREACLPIADELDELGSPPLSSLSFGALDARLARLSVLESRCEEVATDRQSALQGQRRSLWLPADAPDVAVYAYQDLDVSYPVLSAVTALLDRIEEARTAIERAVGYCD
jgi:hypothetical protein